MDIMGRWGMYGILLILVYPLVLMFLQFICLSNQGPLSFPEVLWAWGEDSSSTLHIWLEGEYVEKVEVDWGAWVEYDDNPIGVRDWKHIMINVRRFTDQVITVYDMYTLVSITLMYTAVMVGGMTFNVFNPKTGMVLYLDVKTISNELRVCHSLKVDDHDDNDDSLPDPRLMVEMTGTSGYTKTHKACWTSPCGFVENFNLPREIYWPIFLGAS